MLAQLRQQTKTIMWVVIVGFVGYMFYAWGMNRIQPGGPEPGVVGTVWGDRISVEEFRQEYSNQSQIYYEQEGRRPTTQSEREIAEMAWEAILQKHILYRAAMEEDFEPSDDEILMEIQSNPPGFIRSHPAFQTDSVFDQSKYLSALGDPSLDFSFLEVYVRQSLPFQKLQDYMDSSVRITDEEARMLMRILEEQVTISYAAIDPLSHVREDIPEPSDAEVSGFYSSRIEDFRVPEKRKLRFVRFPKVPSTDDEISSRQVIEEAYDLITEGEPFEEIATEYSDDPSGEQNGGDIGWVRVGRLPAVLDSVAQTLDVGEMSNVIKTEQGFHILRLEEKRPVDETEELRLSYIMIMLETSPMTIEQLRIDGNDLVEAVRGENFEAVAAELGYDAELSAELQFEHLQPMFGIPLSDAQEIFAADETQVVGPVEGEQDFYTIQVAEIVPSRIPALEDIRDFVKQAYVREVRKEKAKAIAESIVRDISAGASLETAAAQRNIDVKTSQSVTRMNFIPGIGRDNIVTASAFALEQGETSGVLEFSDQFYIIRADEKQHMDEQRFRDNVGSIKMSLLATKQQAFMTAWYENLRETVEIEDYRTLR